MKKILAYIISLVTIFFIFHAPVLAFECKDVSIATEGFFVVLEEEISLEKTDKSIPCFRVCEKTIKDKQEHRVCDIKTNCEALENSKESFDCQRIQVIQADSGADLIYTYVGMIYKWAAGTIGIFAVFTLVYSGIGIMAAGGNQGGVDQFKERILQSLMGLVLLFLSGIILYTINPSFFV